MKFTSELRDVTCQWDHTVYVICHPTDRGDRPAFTLTEQVGT